MKNICLVLVLIFVLVPILPGCDGGDTLPYVGPIDGEAPDDGIVAPPPTNGDTPTPPPPPPDDGEPDTGLQPPAPPIFR